MKLHCSECGAFIEPERHFCPARAKYSPLDYGLDPRQLLSYVIRPVLWSCDAWSPAAEVLVLGTGMTESELRYIDQLDRAQRPGPAHGLYQCEERTHNGYWDGILARRPKLRAHAQRLSSMPEGQRPDVTELRWNLAYATLMCRVHFLAVPQALPSISDARGMAVYHKRYYNTHLGATVVEESMRHFQSAIAVSFIT